MPHSRFHRLPPDEQQTILRAAVHEFATHGFARASLNRIIEDAGISKGSMYYYFDGKEDLYAHVTTVELTRMIESAGPFPIPTGRTPDAFWSTLTDYYFRVVRGLAAAPAVAALARGWLAASGSPTLRQAQQQLEAGLVPWFAQAIAAGQRARAIRKDAPADLLIGVVFGMGQAMDAWLMTQPLDERTIARMVPVFVDIIRNALAPPRKDR